MQAAVALIDYRRSSAHCCCDAYSMQLWLATVDAVVCAGFEAVSLGNVDDDDDDVYVVVVVVRLAAVILTSTLSVRDDRPNRMRNVDEEEVEWTKRRILIVTIEEVAE